MAKKKVVGNNTTEPTTLKNTKEEFERALEEQINQGQILSSAPINDDSSYSTTKKAFKEWSDYNLELLKQSFNQPYNEYWRSYDNADQLVGFQTFTMGGRPDPNQKIRTLKSQISYKIDNLISLQKRVPLISYDGSERNSSKILSDIEKNKVFIVHGHDDGAKNEVARFIERLGFEPIILHEQASSGKTIIEKIEAYSEIVRFGVVLYTPCDIGNRKGMENELLPRARQNVVFEHGYLIAKIGRANVSALVKEGVETPNDISGVVYISLTDDWKFALAKEMKQSGYKIDMNLVV